MTAPLIYLVAGEPSGDLLGGRLMDGLRAATSSAVAFAGIGGEAMRAAGLESLFPQADLAVMGLAEVVPRIPRILARLSQTVADIASRRPAAIVTIDFMGLQQTPDRPPQIGRHRRPAHPSGRTDGVGLESEAGS